VKAAPNGAVGHALVVDGSGHTVYRLSGETPRHLLCVGSCTRSWPPLTVSSRRSKFVKGPGVQGRLAMFLRPDGRVQVTLRGSPLYRFSGDRLAGQARGRGIHRSGGVWGIVTARAPKRPPTPPPAPIGGPKLPPNPPPI
jgi:predicted lipoprotein with Yx(FWY)xxD motif